MKLRFFSLGALLSLWLTAAVFPADPVAAWDFTGGTHGWTGNARVAALNATPEGLAVKCLGEDPWIEGPGFDVPAGAMLRVTVTMKSSASPSAQFFYGPSFVPGRNSSFAVQNDGRWHTYTVILPKAGGPRTRLRLDPCDGEARIVVRSIGVEAIRRPKPPVFAKPSTAHTIESPHIVRAGQLRLVHDPKIWNGLRLRFGEKDLEKHANGLGATVLADILEAATLCADEDLITQALAVLDKQTAAYGGTVPRGAQTWEIPLHTPDILASAHLVRAYSFGYILSGRKSYLEQARYWAWTGVPFVYLVNPTDGDGHIRFELAGWGDQPYRLVLAGVAERPADLRVNERVLEARPDPGTGVLVVPLQGPARILIANPAP